ncbi:MAG: hypothetical protein AVDCRST_MAG56-1764, partial [uncultured Cytophagales bacterium]
WRPERFSFPLSCCRPPPRESGSSFLSLFFYAHPLLTLPH